MSPISIGVLAVSMSIDAFIASVGKGASARRPSFGNAIRTGAIFGLVETITPVIGWSAGVAASQYVAQVDHWIAFLLLAAVGVHMVFQALARDAEEEAGPSSLWTTIGTAVGTSLDAMAVGVSLAFLDVNIFIIASAIGLATMVMSSTGMLAGRFLGKRFGRVAEAVGGCALFGLGALILFEHLTAV
ncbi:manganese efflux pump MntP family protein [Paracoccus sp. CPCC 101403]|uniref:Putative manganese efflux pump MntP n=1 Tax=Paracoccus broussonetiae TaxID=3075834 RepID=A0ABU3EIJ7_9RHOB|nr:manganese efflux pump MntP family protein [Paracoccus sp. CPCC 101403]MDT1064034.1 manganese efflux pump MntP family protein [Paracoccus sp. CPCC 101403]